jgi:hypothetical protein
MVRTGANAVTQTVAWRGRRLTVLIGGRLEKTNPPAGCSCGWTIPAVTVVLPLMVAVNSLVPATVSVQLTVVDPVADAPRALVRTTFAVTAVEPLIAAVLARCRTRMQLAVVLPLAVAVRARVLVSVQLTAVLPLIAAVRALTLTSVQETAVEQSASAMSSLVVPAGTRPATIWSLTWSPRSMWTMRLGIVLERVTSH